MQVIGRQEALQQRRPRYFTGKVCVNGHISERNTQKRTCYACDAEAALRKKSKESAAQREKRLAYLQRYNAARREKTKAYDIQYVRANAERLKKVRTAYRTQNADAICTKKREYYEEKRDAILAQKKEYREKNKGRIAHLNTLRKQVVRQRAPAWLTSFDRVKIACYYSVAAMLTRVNNEAWHVDHVLPLRGVLVSGLHVPSNLQLLRGVENISKKNKSEVTNG